MTMRVGMLSRRRIAASAISLVDVALDQTVIQRVGTSKSVSVSGTSDGSDVTVQVINAVSGAVVAEVSRVKVIAGEFSASLAVPQGGWYRLKAIDGRQADVFAVGSNRFGVGVVIAMAGQSNMNGMMTGVSSYPLGSPLSVEYVAGVYRRIGNINDFFPTNTLWPVYSSYTTIGNRGDGYVFIANLISSALGSVPVCLINRAVNGSSITQWQSGQANLAALASAIEASGGDVELFLWFQGESDAAAMSKSTYKTNLGNLHGLVRAMTPRSIADFHFGVISLGVGSYSGSVEGDFGKIRAAHVEYASESEGAFLATAAHDVYTSDGVHIVGEGQSRIGRRVAMVSAAAIAGENKSGPRIVSASISGTVVTLSVEHRGGTSLQDGSGGSGSALAGFRVFDDGVDASISATAIVGSTIEITLSSAPSWAVTVSYAMENCPHGTTTSVTLASAVYDNQSIHGSSVGMLLEPLQLMSVT